MFEDVFGIVFGLGGDKVRPALNHSKPPFSTPCWTDRNNGVLAALANFSTGAKTEKADKCQPFHSFISSRHFPEGFIVAPFKRALI